MSRQWIVPAFAALVAGGLAFGVTRHAACKDSEATLDRLQDISFLTRELKLGEAQVREIKALHITLGAKVNDCCARHCAARGRLDQALADGAKGSAQAEAIVVEMCRAYEESERATLDHMRQVRAVLNVEQRRRFDAMITNCMCRTCTMPGGRMGGTGTDHHD